MIRQRLLRVCIFAPILCVLLGSHYAVPRSLVTSQIKASDLLESQKIQDANVHALVQYALKSATLFNFPVFSRDGKTLLYTDYPAGNAVVHVLRIENGKITSVFKRALATSSDSSPYLFSNGAAFSPDGSLLATSNFTDWKTRPAGVQANLSSIWLWDTKTWKVMRVLEGHSNSISSLAFSDDGQRLISGDMGGGVVIHDLTSGQITTRWHYLNTFKQLFVAFRKGNGEEQAVALTANNYSGTLDPREDLARKAFAQLWDVKTGFVVDEFVDAQDARIAAFSPDASRVAVVGYSGPKNKTIDESSLVVTNWAARAIAKTTKFSSFLSVFAALTYTPDGKNIIASGIGDEGEVLRVFEAPN